MAAAAGAIANAGRIARGAEMVSGFVQTHLTEINAATNAYNLRANAHGFIGALYEDAKLVLSILKPIFSNGNTCSEYMTQGLNYVAYAELVRILSLASDTSLNKYHHSYRITKRATELTNTWDPVRLYTIELDIPFEMNSTYRISNDPVSIPYTFVDEANKEYTRVLWAYPFVQAQKLVKVEFWTDRKFLIDFFRGCY